MTRPWITSDELLILFRYPAEVMSASAKKAARHRIKVATGLAPEPGSPATRPTYDRKEAQAAWNRKQQLKTAA